VQRRVRIIADGRTNSLVISAEEGDLKDVLRLVANLDVQVVNEKAPAAQPRKAVSYEIVLFALSSGADVAAKLPRTSSGVIDTSDPAAVLGKLRESVGQTGLTEVAKLSVMADDGRPWKWRQSVSIPVIASGGGFNGYQEASVELALAPETARGGSRRLGISGRIERFADTAKSNDREGVPPPKSTSTIDFSSSIEDGKLVMSAVESAASKFDASYVLFVRVKN
jgi:hypothetical protein